MFLDKITKIRYRIGRLLNISVAPIYDFEANQLDTIESIDLLKESQTELERIFYSNNGRIVHKWLHYLPHYDHYFSKYINTDVKMLEIGVCKGGSLDMWRKYFGESATIFGIDINPECANVATPPNQVRIGSQADPDFLAAVIREMGAPDLILDDGSHVACHQLESFKALWPALKMGGIYAIEDMHTSYWPGVFEGGYRRKGTAVELLKTIIDDMHGWYHKRPSQFVEAGQITGIHVFDSVVFIEKGLKATPKHIKVGRAAQEAN